ncbi:hypothetical protein GCM10010918_15550 [Paenibacillus radicis (ex Gao et al. 2016)]|uniref:WYL domain-containing protein n=2 Tax=Paenibacillus radicis (ex Gao et al. 2016) TaxID=1737354 RepID=A0A917LWX0_9BACL|nr:hypothetical protein GCM10010918_15550 [Paenibacillus radicis (ex Gao et al. 2016)]
MHLSNMHRIQWFDQQIRESRYPNSSQLAEKFEISKRQAQRDIEYMNITLRAPLAYIAKHRGYMYEEQTYILPHLYMTEDEKRILQFLIHRYRQYDYDNADAANRVAYLLERFTDAEDDSSHNRLPVFEFNPKLMQTVLLLSDAMKTERAVDILYEGERLHIFPVKFESRYNIDYIVSYCEQNQKQRMLRLGAIEQIEIAEQSKRNNGVMPVKAYPIDEPWRPIQQPFTAKIQLMQQPGPSWGGFTARPAANSSDLYEIEFYDTEAFLRHLMTSSWSALLAPKWLREKLHARCGSIMNRLNGEEDE